MKYVRMIFTPKTTLTESKPVCLGNMVEILWEDAISASELPVLNNLIFQFCCNVKKMMEAIYTSVFISVKNYFSSINVK